MKPPLSSAQSFIMTFWLSYRQVEGFIGLGLKVLLLLGLAVA